MAALGPGGSGKDASTTHMINAAAGAMGAGVLEVGSGQGGRGFASINAGEEQGGGTFQHGARRAAEKVGETHVDGFLAAANGQNQAAVGIEFDAKTGRAAFASDACEDALEEGGASGNDGRSERHWSGYFTTRRCVEQNAAIIFCGARGAGLRFSWLFRRRSWHRECLRWRRQDCLCRCRVPCLGWKAW